MEQKARKLLKRQRDRQLISIVSAGTGFIFLLLAGKFASGPLWAAGVLFCMLGAAFYLRTTCHITALKAYDMGNTDGAEGEYNLIRDLRQADPEKEDYTD
ncbi:MAG: hypothetical protein GF408_07490 [Candidatus Omnitrophica bacterium]|nr:hypothetical protein [Candidatus Omnitrophota bacterium]